MTVYQIAQSEEKTSVVVFPQEATGQAENAMNCCGRQEWTDEPFTTILFLAFNRPKFLVTSAPKAWIRKFIAERLRLPEESVSVSRKIS